MLKCKLTAAGRENTETTEKNHFIWVCGDSNPITNMNSNYIKTAMLVVGQWLLRGFGHECLILHPLVKTSDEIPDSKKNLKIRGRITHQKP